MSPPTVSVVDRLLGSTGLETPPPSEGVAMVLRGSRESGVLVVPSGGPMDALVRASVGTGVVAGGGVVGGAKTDAHSSKQSHTHIK